jgi:hypothetical protein
MDEMIQKLLDPQDPIWVTYDIALTFNLVMLYRLASEMLLIKVRDRQV